ncbi:hypothetical protein ABFT51_16685 [Paenibacillus peoriae]
MAGHDAASVELNRNVSFIEQALFYTDDLKKQAISVDGKDGMLLYIDSLVDQEMIQTHILSALYEKIDAVSHQIVKKTPTFKMLLTHLFRDIAFL